MSQTAAIERLTLISLMERFSLEETTDDDFFLEWKDSLPELSDYERDRLARITTIYQNFKVRDALESTVSLTIVSPLIEAAGLFFPPFYVETEKPVEITLEDGDLIVRGRLDILVIKESLWILIIETKRAGLSIDLGLPQVLAYMLAAPTPQSILYGMVTNGKNFVFVKLDRSSKGRPVYAQSEELIINRGNDLERALKIMKRLAAVIAE